MEEAALARICAISDPADVEDPEYVSGLREAVTAGVTYGLAAIDAPRSQVQFPEPAPIQFLAQARHAARSGVSLDTVLRRCFAGYTLLGDFLVQVAGEGALPPSELQRVLRGVAVLFDRLVASVSEEYKQEVDRHSHTVEERRAARVRMLLGGEPVDAASLGYELDAWHIGLIADGSDAREVLRRLATSLDRRMLAVSPEPGIVWAWFGGRKMLPSSDILRQVEMTWPGDVALAVGEPGHGIMGWRLSHRQAKSALLVARLGPERRAAYADVGLIAAMLQDEVLTTYLLHVYLDPLADERDGGETLRQTLRAYFTAERNASSAAAALGVSRRTVANRLRVIEERLDRPISVCGSELEAALRLDELRRAADRLEAKVSSSRS